MASWRDKVKAAVYAVIGNITSVEAGLIMEVLFELSVNIIQNWFVTIPIVDSITVARGVNHCKSESDAALLNFNCRLINFYRLFDLKHVKIDSTKKALPLLQRREALDRGTDL